MPNKLLLAISFTLVAPLLASCGSDGPAGPGGGGLPVSGSISANISGAAWTNSPISLTGQAQAGGIFSFGGASANGTVVSITLRHIGAPGTYPLGVNGTNPGGLATVSTTTPFDGWTTPLSGDAGSVTVTTVTASRIAGTFTFTATPAFGAAVGNRAVTQGQFDITYVTPGGITIAPNAGSTFGGTLNSVPWNAATIVTVSHPSSGVMTIGATNTTHSVNVTISGFTGVGVYGLGTGVVRHITVTSGTQVWGGAGTASIGLVEVTSYNTSRVQGTYTAVLGPNVGATGNVSLQGSFSVGFPD